MSLELNDVTPRSGSEVHSEAASFAESDLSVEPQKKSGRLEVLSLFATVLTTLGVFGLFFFKGLLSLEFWGR